MSRGAWRRWLPADEVDGEGGFSLAELMVAMTLFVLVSGLMFSVVMSGSRVVTTTRTYNDLNEEARVMINRMSRELREAKEIAAVVDPGTGDGHDGITFNVDFNGDGTIQADAVDPETLIYQYDPVAKKVTLKAGGFAYDVLATNVTRFRLDFSSSAGYAYDTNADGTTTWEEIDQTVGVGDSDGVLDWAELQYIDSVTIRVTLFEGKHRQDYRTTIDLRNSAAT